MTAGWTDRRLKVALFIAATAAYLGVGYWLQVQHGFIMGDALSRVFAAQSVLFSRDPHLAAIGFIFTPLTAMVELPAIVVSPLWAPMTERAFSGTIMSSIFMAGAVIQIFGIGADRGLPRWYSLTIAILFAANPMIVFYGSNGMSEAPFIFFLAWAARRLIMWIADDDVHHLVAAGGIAMGLAYLTRYDAVVCIAAAGILVGLTTYLRARPPPRLRRALLDLLLVSGPGFVAFVGWAVASWLITGQAFAQFSSQYGNAAILQQSGATAPGLTGGLSFALVCVALLAPTLVPIAVWAATARLRWHNWQAMVVPLALYGAVLAFQAFSYSSGSTFGFLRFYIVAVPFAATLALLAVPDGVLMAGKRRGRYAPPAPQPMVLTARRRWAFVAGALAFAIGLPVTAWGMSQPRYAPQEYAVGAVFSPQPDSIAERKAIEHRIAASFSTEREIAAFLDRLNLPDSSVLTDTVYGFAIVAASARPKTYVVPSDPDFVALLNDPVSSNIQYMLAVPATGRGTSDALNQRYPTVYETGADIATLALEIPNNGDSQPTWRLYRVNKPVPAS